MPESIEHINCVNLLSEYFRKIIPQNNHELIFYDKSDSKYKPHKMAKGHIPDVFYLYDKLMVIGEAKALKDVDRSHSIEQYEDYYEEAYNFNGEAIIVMAVPWMVHNTVKNIFRIIRKKYEDIHKVKIVVISENNLIGEL